MSERPIGDGVARLLLEAGSVHVSRAQPFILAAGWASPVYVDCRLLIGQPRVRRAITEFAAQHLGAAFPPGTLDAIAGAETAGIPFAAWLAEAAGLKLRYVRKRPLGIGRNAQVEGGTVEGLRVLLMDDLTTDGGSKLAFTRGLRAAGATVEHVLTIFYHGAFPGARERLAAAGLTLHALATWEHVLAAATPDLLAAEDRETVARFLADPVSWSTRHGGRTGEAKRS